MRWLAVALIVVVLLPMAWILPPLVEDCRYGMGEEIVKGDLNAVAYRLENGCDPNGEGQEHGIRSPLQTAVDAGQFRIAALLVEHGAIPDIEKDSLPLLAWAVSKASPELVQVLLEKGADPNGRMVFFDRYPLHAARGDSSLVVDLLVQAGANPDAQDRHGQAPLHLMGDADLPTALALIRAGADPNIRDVLGRTPLQVAAIKGELQFARLLLQAGADPDAGDHQLQTPLHEAAYAGDLKMAELLVDHGASGDARTRYGWTPWDAYQAGRAHQGGTLPAERFPPLTNP